MRPYHKKRVSSIIYRYGFTQIELIFVIIVIGILAAVAIPKLAATRDDAKLSANVSNMAICIKDAAAHYTATRIDYNDTVHSSACDKNNTICYDFTYAINGKDFNVSTDSTGTDSAGIPHSYCADIDYVGGYLAKSYDFGGSSVNR